MTGVMQELVANASGAISSAIVLADTRAGATASAQVVVNPDGSIAVTGSGSSATPPRWFASGNTPAWWCSCTLNSGSFATSSTGASGAVVAIAGAPTWYWGQGAVGTISGNCTLRIFSDAAGTQLQASSTFGITVQRTS